MGEVPTGSWGPKVQRKTERERERAEWQPVWMKAKASG